MSASTLVTIFCDAKDCGTWHDAGMAPTAREAREQLKRMGWAVNVFYDDPTIHRRYRADFCPRHKWQKGEELR